jgi:hypothetical protein
MRGLPRLRPKSHPSGVIASVDAINGEEHRRIAIFSEGHWETRLSLRHDDVTIIYQLNSKGHDTTSQSHGITRPIALLLVHIGPCAQLPPESEAWQPFLGPEREDGDNKLISTVAVSPPELDIGSFAAIVVLCLVKPKGHRS